jgi:hypothetical protein
MAAFLEVAAIVALIVAVWFALLGWKLMTPSRARFGRHHPWSPAGRADAPTVR